MAETSYPLNDQPFLSDQWSDIVGQMGDGILDDWGDPYAITVNTNDTVTIGVSSSGTNLAVVGGFAHRQDTPVTLTVAAVTSPTRYHVGLLYDPAKTAQPVQLRVLSTAATAGAAPDMSGGKVFVPLVTFDRASGQTLAQATKRVLRPRRVSTIFVETADALTNTSPLLYLRGTRAIAMDTGVEYIADGTKTTAAWSAVDATGVIYQSAAAGSTALAAANKTTTLHRVDVTLAAERAVQITFTAIMQTGTRYDAQSNWAGSLYITLDGSRVGLYRRVANLNMYGNAAMPVERTVKVTIPAGTHTIAAVLSNDPLSGVGVYFNNPQIEVWPA